MGRIGTGGRINTRSPLIGPMTWIIQERTLKEKRKRK